MSFQVALEKKIQTLTTGEIATALRQYIDLKRLVVVGAGDFETKTATSGN